jgi:hypothetical protein
VRRVAVVSRYSLATDAVRRHRKSPLCLMTARVDCACNPAGAVHIFLRRRRTTSFPSENNGDIVFK